MTGGKRERADQPEDLRPRPAGVELGEQLEKLAELREQGILTEEEFAAEKKALLGS